MASARTAWASPSDFAVRFLQILSFAHSEPVPFILQCERTQKPNANSSIKYGDLYKGDSSLLLAECAAKAYIYMYVYIYIL